MRAWNYHSLSLSNDELSAWNRLNATSIADLWENGVKPDGHPALVQTTLYLWFKIFPSEPWSFRLLFIVAGTLSVGFFFELPIAWPVKALPGWGRCAWQLCNIFLFTAN